MHHFEFEVPGIENFVFTPGQFVSVVERLGSKEITRAYSIASPRDGNRFALCLNRVPDGIVSSYLFQLNPGDEVEMHEPLGFFTLRHPGHRAVFIATGTGIAPFRSMLLDHLPKNHPRITLLFGVRYERGLLYRDELERLEKEHDTFRFLPTITRPSEDWRGLTGRVQAHLDEALAIPSYEDLATLDVYVCGLKEMVDSVRAELKKRGFDRKQIIYEKYD
ncbi:MAG: oxidoreductase [Acidobacteriaceae bacterium]|nr:oxidoreductase [Acidobacteriaceae bacterium]MBV9781865.1 oxidoreductase [Acidobacteriaceae bacterium]